MKNKIEQEQFDLNESYKQSLRNKKDRNPTLTKNMPNVKMEGKYHQYVVQNPQGVNDGNVYSSNKQVGTSKKSHPEKLLNRINSFVNGNQGWILLAILVYLIRYLQA